MRFLAYMIVPLILGTIFIEGRIQTYSHTADLQITSKWLQEDGFGVLLTDDTIAYVTSDEFRHLQTNTPVKVNYCTTLIFKSQRPHINAIGNKCN